MARQGSKSGEAPVPGPAADRFGNPVWDPSRNVLDLVAAAIARQDDLRKMESGYLAQISTIREEHARYIAELRAEYVRELREAETARIDAIRAVDVGAVNRAAEVSATQAATLATQVATSAEALRGQVEAARQQTATALAAALEPIQKDIQDLRRAQYEAQGQKTQVVETREVQTGTRMSQSTAIAFAVLLVAVVSLILLYATKK